MGMDNMLKKAQRTLGNTAAAVMAVDGMNTVDVILHWKEPSALPADHHPDLVSTQPATHSDQQSDPFKAFAHYVNHGTSTFQRFAEVKNGDVLADIPADIEIDGKNEPRFEINGSFFTQKNVGKELSSTWDAFTGQGNATLRTILLKPAK